MALKLGISRVIPWKRALMLIEQISLSLHCYLNIPFYLLFQTLVNLECMDRMRFLMHVQGRIQDLVLGGTKFGKVIWERYYYCLRCLWNVWCRKIKIDLQVIMIIWGEETEDLFSLFLFSFFIYFLCLFGFFVFLRGANVPSALSESASDVKHILSSTSYLEILFNSSLYSCHTCTDENIAVSFYVHMHFVYAFSC